MSEIIVTPRTETDSQIIRTVDVRNLFVFDCKTVAGVYKNISGALETAKMGQLMGKVAATGKWAVCKSAALDGSETPRGVLCVEITDAAINQEVNVDICTYGEIAKNEVQFNGADTFDTLVGGVRIEDLLITNAQSIRLTTVKELSQYANY